MFPVCIYLPIGKFSAYMSSKLRRKRTAPRGAQGSPRAQDKAKIIVWMCATTRRAYWLGWSPHPTPLKPRATRLTALRAPPRIRSRRVSVFYLTPLILNRGLMFSGHPAPYCLLRRHWTFVARGANGLRTGIRRLVDVCTHAAWKPRVRCRRGLCKSKW